MKNSIVLSVLSSLALVLVVLVFSPSVDVNSAVNAALDKRLGANPGRDHLELENFFGGLMYGSVIATTTGENTTMVLRDFDKADVVSIMPGKGGADPTLTFPATSTLLSWLPKTGQMQKTCFMNATSTAGIDVVFAGGTGWDMENASSSRSDLTIHPNNTGCITFIRQADSDITAALLEFVDAD